MDKKDLEQTVEETVEQGFNDSELEDIMNEIESLEKEFADEAPVEEVVAETSEVPVSEDIFSGEISEGPAAEAVADESLSLNAANDNNLQNAIDKEVENIETEMNVQSIADDLFGELAEELNAPEASEAHSTEDVTAEPVMEEVTAEPVMEEVTAEPVIEEVTAEPVMEEVTAEPVMEEVTAEPVMEEVAAGPVMEDNVVEFTPKAAPIPNSEGMSLNASGTMDMNLTFPVGESEATLKIVNGELCVSMQGVELLINDQDGCTVTTEGGVKFTIPLTSAETDSKKKAI